VTSKILRGYDFAILEIKLNNIQTNTRVYTIEIDRIFRQVKTGVFARPIGAVYWLEGLIVSC